MSKTEDDDDDPGGGGGGGGGGGDFLLWAANGDEGELLDVGEFEEEVDDEPTLICARNSAGKLSLSSLYCPCFPSSPQKKDRKRIRECPEQCDRI